MLRKTGGKRCVHCKVNKGYRARGLCFGCSLKPSIRKLYPAKSHASSRQGIGLVATSVLSTPTYYLPTTEGKIIELQKRAEAGADLFNCYDANMKEHVLIPFDKFEKVHTVVNSDSLYADIANHCKEWNYFKVPGSQTSSAHEATHGINNDIRNKHGVNYTIFYPSHARANSNRNMRYGMLPSFTNLSEDGIMYSAEKVNAFYLGYDRCLVIPEPKCRKRDAAPFVPDALKASRFGLYVTGQREWDDMPLYLFDEWVASYANGAHTGIDLKKRNELTDTHGLIDGVVEFIAYGIATVMAADKVDDLQPLLKDFTCFMIRRSFNAHYQARVLGIPSYGEEKVIDMLLNKDEGKTFRDFSKQKLGIEFPTKEVPEDKTFLKDMGTYIWS